MRLSSTIHHSVCDSIVLLSSSVPTRTGCTAVVDIQAALLDTQAAVLDARAAFYTQAAVLDTQAAVTDT